MSEKEVVYYDFDNFRLDPQNEQLLKDGESVMLTNKAFQTLFLLVQNSGQIVEKENIYNELWADSFVEESNLTQYVYLLRKTLGKNPAGISYIDTVPRRGYIFTSPVIKVRPPRANGASSVTSLAESFQHAAIGSSMAGRSGPHSLARLRLVKEREEELPSEAPDLAPEPAEAAIEKQPRLLKADRVAGIMVLTAATLLVFGYLYRWMTPVDPSGVRSIAVLPFKAIGQESIDAKYGLGMADAIITRFSKLHGIPVRPTSAVAAFTDEPITDVRATGKALGVDAVLEGTVQRDGEYVRVTVQLTKISDGQPIWADAFDERTADIFQLQDSISNKVARALSLKLTPQQWKMLEQHPTNDPRALEAFQIGVYYWTKRTKDGLERAQTNFQTAIERDPNYARATAMLADTYNLKAYYGFANRSEMIELARLNAERALAMDDSLAEAHMALAFTENDSSGRPRMERAIELAPYNSTARVRYAWILVRAGDMEKAIDQIRLAKEYDPLSPISNGGLCNILMFQEKFAEAVKICEKAVEYQPDSGNGRMALANAYFFNGDPDAAIAQLKHNIDQDVDKYSSMGSLGLIYAKTGRKAEAEGIVTVLKNESSANPELLNDLALISYALGRHDESLVFFTHAVENRSLRVFMVKNDPPWKDLRSDPRFIEVLNRPR
ncbi:MAG: tetratricopeptide repeat protein [Acidobacteriota bacterium]